MSRCLAQRYTRGRKRKFTPLSFGPDKLLWLIKSGVDVNHIFREHTTPSPLAVAVEGGNIELVKLLLELQCNIDQESDTGETALFLAIRTKQINMVGLLIEAGANINHQSINHIMSRTNASRPIFEAIKCGQKSIVELLLAHKVELKCKMRDNHNQSPIQWALECYLERSSSSRRSEYSRYLHTDMVRLLLPEVDLSECESYLQSLFSCRSTLLYEIIQHMTVSTGSTFKVGKGFRSSIPVDYMDFLDVDFVEEFLWFFQQSCSYGNFYSYYDCHVKTYNTLALHKDYQWVLQTEEWESYMVSIKKLFSNPLSLQTFCCQVIRKQLSNYRMWYRIDKLPLPTLLKKKLKLIK